MNPFLIEQLHSLEGDIGLEYTPNVRVGQVTYPVHYPGLVHRGGVLILDEFFIVIYLITYFFPVFNVVVNPFVRVK